MVSDATICSPEGLLAEARSAAGLSGGIEGGQTPGWKPLVDIDSEASPVFPAAAWGRLDLSRLRPALRRIREYYEELSQRRDNDVLTEADRQVLLFAARLTDVLSLRFPDLFSPRSVKHAYLSLLTLTATAIDYPSLVAQVLLRFLKRGWISDAAALAKDATAASRRGAPQDGAPGGPDDSKSGCGVESTNVLSLYHYLAGEAEIAESMVLSALDCACETSAPDLSDEGIGLTLQLFVNYARILAGTNRKAQAIQCFSILQRCLDKECLTPEQSTVFGRRLPEWFQRRCRAAEEHLLRMPNRIIAKEILWLLLPPGKELAAAGKEYRRVPRAGDSDVEFIVQGLVLWGEGEHELAWAAWQSALLYAEERETFAIACFVVATYYSHKGRLDLARASAILVVRCLKARINEANPLSARDTQLTRLLGQLMLPLGMDAEYLQLVELVRHAAIASENEMALSRISAVP